MLLVFSDYKYPYLLSISGKGGGALSSEGTRVLLSDSGAGIGVFSDEVAPGKTINLLPFINRKKIIYSYCWWRKG